MLLVIWSFIWSPDWNIQSWLDWEDQAWGGPLRMTHHHNKVLFRVPQMTVTTSNRLQGGRGLREYLVWQLLFRVVATEAQNGNSFTQFDYKLLAESGFKSKGPQSQPRAPSEEESKLKSSEEARLVPPGLRPPCRFLLAQQYGHISYPLIFNVFLSEGIVTPTWWVSRRVNWYDRRKMPSTPEAIIKRQLLFLLHMRTPEKKENK